MKQFSEQLHKKAQTTVKLRVAEQQELRERLLSYMEYHPLPSEIKAPAVKAKKIYDPAVFEDNFAGISLPFISFFKSSVVAVAILLLIVPFIAEKAVPGDVLYAVKVRFNEELRSTLTFDGYQKVEWETERVNRRVAEVRLLASEGRLTNEVEVEMAEAVRVHTESAKREIEALRAEDADEATMASIALDTTLEVQSAALKEAVVSVIGDEPSSTGTSLIVDVIDESRNYGLSQNSTSTLPSYDKMAARIEQNTTRIYELRDALNGVASEEEISEVSRRIVDVERSMLSVIEQQTTDEEKAKQLSLDVLQRTQKLIIYITELEVTKAVDIEKIVPVVLTNEEKQAEINRITNQLSNKKEQINSILVDINDISVQEKVVHSQILLDDLTNRMASSTDVFTAFTSYAREANALADDTIIFLNKHFQPQNDNSVEEIIIPVDISTSSNIAEGELDVDTQ